MLRKKLHVRERHPLHEDRLPTDLQQRGPPADTGAKRHGSVHKLAQPAITSQGEGRGDSAVGGQTRVFRHAGTLDRHVHRNATSFPS
uniref:hypothetical protein n=1 Tax=Streptomyces sp. NRRL S-813 TaxID=1463919 RepID=UPI001F469D0F